MFLILVGLHKHEYSVFFFGLSLTYMVEYNVCLCFKILLISEVNFNLGLNFCSNYLKPAQR